MAGDGEMAFNSGRRLQEVGKFRWWWWIEREEPSGSGEARLERERVENIDLVVLRKIWTVTKCFTIAPFLHTASLKSKRK